MRPGCCRRSASDDAAVAARGAGRLRPRVGGDGSVRHGARVVAAALPHRHPRGGRRRRRGGGLPPQGVGRRAQPGRRAGQRPSRLPLGPRRPFLLRAGAALAVCFVLLFAGPTPRVEGARASYVVVLFLACATAYAFFQVPFVAMPAEMTDSYDERTRLLSWRVALLALTILVSGATAPAIRDALGGHAGYRAMGVFVACAHPGRHARCVLRHSPRAGRVGGCGRRRSRRPAPPGGPGPRLPHAADDVRAAGAGDRVDAGGRRLRRAGGARTSAASTYPVRLLRRPGARC